MMAVFVQTTPTLTIATPEELFAVPFSLTGSPSRNCDLGKIVFGFDSFEEFGETLVVNLDLGGPALVDKHPGGFAGTSFERVNCKLKLFGLRTSARLVPGYFEESLSEVADRTFSFVHLDCDLYRSYNTTGAECLILIAS